ncbi:MAG: hypothetical protein ACK4K0_09555 [Flavobacteriales bacterium]
MNNRFYQKLKPLTHPFFAVSFLLALLHYLLQQEQLSLRIFTSYLDDLLAMPVILPICTSLIRLFFDKPDFKLPVFYLVSTLVVMAVVFEWILPDYSTRYTADWIDVPVYAVGTLLYSWFRY